MQVSWMEIAALASLKALHDAAAASNDEVKEPPPGAPLGEREPFAAAKVVEPASIDASVPPPTAMEVDVKEEEPCEGVGGESEPGDPDGQREPRPEEASHTLPACLLAPPPCVR